MGMAGKLEFGFFLQILAEGHVGSESERSRWKPSRTVWGRVGEGLGPSIRKCLKVQGPVVSGMAESRSSGLCLRLSALLSWMLGELFPPGAPLQLQA